MGILLNSSQIENLSIKLINKNQKQMVDKWSKLGFLDGLTGHVKTNIAQMYECCASSLLNEVDTTGDTTDLIVYKKDIPMIPIVKRVLSQIPEGLDIVSVVKSSGDTKAS